MVFHRGLAQTNKTVIFDNAAAAVTTDANWPKNFVDGVGLIA
jgi:hypothetical protein